MSANKLDAASQRQLDIWSEGYCEYCKFPEAYASGYFHNEHIRPQSKGGLKELMNIARACDHCNQAKSNHTTGFDPQTGEEVPLFHPRRQEWTDHFRWSDDLRAILGRTPTGRATVEAMHLNRTSVMNIRRVTMGEEHPPPGTVLKEDES